MALMYQKDYLLLAGMLAAMMIQSHTTKSIADTTMEAVPLPNVRFTPTTALVLQSKAEGSLPVHALTGNHSIEYGRSTYPCSCQYRRPQKSPTAYLIVLSHNL